MRRNSLDQETSTYLLSHKDNPVHWRSWSPEILAEARSSGKPILLSSGYMACHWCHRMNEESFADADIAAVINDHFIPVLIDREERPDVDQVYQSAAHTMGHSGGWPLTIFLTPEGRPYSVGGYFPTEAREGLAAFKEVLAEAARLWREQPEDLTNASKQIEESLGFLWTRNMRGPFHPRMLDDIALHYGQRFDIFFGGVTGSPKFPSTAMTETLWRGFLRTGLEQFSQLVQTTLNNMSMGALFDHLGGGFFRYCNDERWLVPNFEKTLIDNAQLIDILTTVYQFTRYPLYHDRIDETVTWLLRDMRCEKAFAANIAADTEGEQGKYYVWTEAEVDAALKGTYSQRFKDIYMITREGNHNGKNLLIRMGANASYPLSDADEAMLAKQRALLLEARAKRRAPLRDDKIMADCNGLVIAALANAGNVFRKQAWIDAAIEAFHFITTAMADGDKLFHTWRAGTRGHVGFADDYAAMARAALVLHEATGDPAYLDHAKAWTRTLNLQFWDTQNGGYCTNTEGDDGLFIRPKMIFDQVLPAPNSVMVQVLYRLFLLTGDESYRERCNALIEAFSGELTRTPLSLPNFLNGIDTVLMGLHIVIIGDRANARTQELAQAVLGRTLPGKFLTIVKSADDLPASHPAHGKPKESGQPTAYICQNQTCSPAFINPVALSQALILPAQLAAQLQAQQQQAQMGQAPLQAANNPGPALN